MPPEKSARNPASQRLASASRWLVGSSSSRVVAWLSSTLASSTRRRSIPDRPRQRPVEPAGRDAEPGRDPPGLGLGAVAALGLEPLLEPGEPLDGPVAGPFVGALVDPPPGLLQLVAGLVQPAGRQQPGQPGRGGGRRRLLRQPGQLPDQGDHRVSASRWPARFTDRSRLVLPAPLGPTSPTTSPGATVKLASATSRRCPTSTVRSTTRSMADVLEMDGLPTMIGARPSNPQPIRRHGRPRSLCLGGVCDPTRAEGHLRHGVLDPLARLGSGMAMLERGGNAFDAAAAAGFVLQVVEPHLNGPGGDVPILAVPRPGRAGCVICGQGPRPAAATIGASATSGSTLVPGTGLLPACVPGAFGAWMRLLAEHGTLPPARRAGAGHRLRRATASRCCPESATRSRALVRAASATEWTDVGRGLAARRRVPPAAGPSAQPGSCRDLRRLLAEAEAAAATATPRSRPPGRFYEGFVAEAIDDFWPRPALDATAGGTRGLLTARTWPAGGPRSRRRCPPIRRLHGVQARPVDARGRCSSSSCGCSTGFDLAAMGPAARRTSTRSPSAPSSPSPTARPGTATRRTSTSRSTALLYRGLRRAPRALIGPEASLELRPGSPDGRDPRVPESGAPWPADGGRASRTASGGADRRRHLPRRRGDRFGNMVAATPSGGWLQSSPVVPGLGFRSAPAARCSG